MFCALNGATLTPRRASSRQRPVVTWLLPASLVVPHTISPPLTGDPRASVGGPGGGDAGRRRWWQGRPSGPA